MKNKQRTVRSLTAAAIAVAFAYLFGMADKFDTGGHLFGLMRVLLYFALFTAWILRVKRTVQQQATGRYLLISGVLMIFWLYIRSIKLEFVLSPCVIRFYDAVSESYSFGLKRLNRQDENEVVVEYAFITKPFSRVLPSRQRDALLGAISYENIKCKVNKLSYYNEMFVKAYVVHNDTAYQKALELLNMNLWYDADKTVALYLSYKDLVSQKYMLSKVTTQAEKLPCNIKIKKNIEILNQFLEEK